MNQTLEAISKMIDHSLLNPAMNDKDLKDGCELAKQYHTASVCIKPYAVKLAADLLKGSDVLVGTVIGFPHGNSSIKVKVFETEQACIDGAVEIDMVVNVGKVLSEDWAYVEDEIAQINQMCLKHDAILKVIFENDYLENDADKIKLCQICDKLKVAYVKTSTGYGFVKQADGSVCAKGATDNDLILMKANVSNEVKVKAAGGIKSLEDCNRIKNLGTERIGTSATKSILEAIK